MFGLEGKVAVITGASRGIGRAAATLFAQAGCNVVVNYRSNKVAADDVVTLAESQGVRASAICADVSVKSDSERLISESIERMGGIDILVNNAGIWKEAAIERMTEGELAEMVDINLKGSFYPTTAIVPYFKTRGSGNIIFVASTAGQRGEAFHSHYAASKGAIISLTKSLASELAPHNIRVNCVAPGWVDTDMSHEELVAPDAERHLSLIPMRRAGSPEEIAGPILFLASNLSTFMTGEILNVNGGAVLCG